ncbi:MAG: methylamine utilization protein [Pseudomonadota bacterium]
MRVLRYMAVGLLLLLGHPVGAAELIVQVTDGDGRPVPDAVVGLTPSGADTAGVTAHAPPLTRLSVVDQRNETFIPYVQIVPRGGEVTFRNSDLTRHHVYSFSPAKAFEFVLAPGEASEPVHFERAGVVAVGCNIHDRMVAYLYVTDLPWVTLTDAQGRAVLRDLPESGYVVHTWHPRLRPGRPEPSQTITLVGLTNQLPVSLALVRDQPQHHDRERARY